MFGKNKKGIISIIIVVIIIGLIITFIVMRNNKISMEHEYDRRLHLFDQRVCRELYIFDKNISFEKKELDYKETTILQYFGNDEYTINKYGEILACIEMNKKTSEIDRIYGDNIEIKKLFIEKFKDRLSTNFK